MILSAARYFSSDKTVIYVSENRISDGSLKREKAFDILGRCAAAHRNACISMRLIHWAYLLQ